MIQIEDIKRMVINDDDTIMVQFQVPMQKEDFDKATQAVVNLFAELFPKAKVVTIDPHTHISVLQKGQNNGNDTTQAE